MEEKSHDSWSLLNHALIVSKRSEEDDASDSRPMEEVFGALFREGDCQRSAPTRMAFHQCAAAILPSERQYSADQRDQSRALAFMASYEERRHQSGGCDH